MSWGSLRKVTEDYLLTRVIPSNWKAIEIPYFRDLVAFVRNDGLKLIITIEWQDSDPDIKWLHASMSFKSKLPTYQDMKIVKNIFIGEDRTAFQVFPPSDQHINLHENTLHLFSCLTKDILPDFRREGGI
jgi:hypothetical protein